MRAPSEGWGQGQMAIRMQVVAPYGTLLVAACLRAHVHCFDCSSPVPHQRRTLPRNVGLVLEVESVM